MSSLSSFCICLSDIFWVFGGAFEYAKGGNGCDKPGQGGEAARSSADAEASTSPSRQPGNNEMLFVGDVVTSASHSYVVQRMVSQGSTSLCFVAEDTNSRIQYALKVRDDWPASGARRAGSDQSRLRG